MLLWGTLYFIFYNCDKPLMLLPARSALQNWPSGTSLQQSLFRLILGWKPNNHATFFGTHIYWRTCIAYHVAIRAHVVLMDPEYGATPLCAHAGVRQPASPVHFFIFGFGFTNTYLGRFPKASPTLSQEEPGSGVKNHLWRTMKWENFVKITLVVLWSSCSSRCSTGWCPCWSICRLDWIRIRLDSMFRCFIKRLRPGPGVREHADRKVRLAEGMCTHQGDHLE